MFFYYIVGTYSIKKSCFKHSVRAVGRSACSLKTRFFMIFDDFPTLSRSETPGRESFKGRAHSRVDHFAKLVGCTVIALTFVFFKVMSSDFESFLGRF